MILARGHGSRAVKQCRSSEVTSFEITGKASPVGWYHLPGSIMPLLFCVCRRACVWISLMVAPCLFTSVRRYLMARTAARRVPGPHSTWFLTAAAKISRASSLSSRHCSLGCDSNRHVLGLWKVVWNFQAGLSTPSVEEVPRRPHHERHPFRKKK